MVTTTDPIGPQPEDIHTLAARIRELGGAVAVFTPNEVGEVERRRIEDAMFAAGNEVIALLDERPSCDWCGERFTIDDAGIANHLGEEGGVDHDADADHVPFTREG